ncbi:MAG: caspase family protein, partial [Clostridiales bacterium]|nr:caspase family protein [Clostridiales bacterium]
MKKIFTLLLAVVMSVFTLTVAFSCTVFAASEEPVYFSNFAVYGDTVYIPSGYESFVSGMKQHEGLPDVISGKVIIPGTDISSVRDCCYYGGKIYYRTYPEAGAGASYTVYSCDLNGENDTFIAYVLSAFICNNTLYYSAYEGEDDYRKIALYTLNLSDLSSRKKLTESSYFSVLDFLDSYYENLITLYYFDGGWLYYTLGSNYTKNTSYYKMDINGSNITSVSSTLDEFSNNYYYYSKLKLYGNKAYYFNGSTLYERDRNGGNAVSLCSVSPADAKSAYILTVTDDYIYYSIQGKYVYKIERPKSPDITVYFNSEKLEFDEGQEAMIIDGNVMVPMKTIFEAFGATVDLDNETKNISAHWGNSYYIHMTIDSNKMDVANVLKDETKTIELSMPPKNIENNGITGDYTVIPIKDVSETLNAKFNYDEHTKTVRITNPETMRALITVNYDDDEQDYEAFQNSGEFAREALTELGISNINYFVAEDSCYTRSDLISELENTFKDTDWNDFSVIYYSGHTNNSNGSYSPTIYDDSSELIGFITFYEFYSLIRQNISGEVLIIYDGCYAGTLIDEVVNNIDSRIKIIGASKSDEKSNDYYITRINDTFEFTDIFDIFLGDYCSLFSYAFYDGIVNNIEDIDVVNDRNITLKELTDYLRKRVNVLL